MARSSGSVIISREAVRERVRICCAPKLVGYNPVISAARLGEQTPLTENAFVNLIPSAARLSIIGVLARGSPQQPRRALISSQVIQSIFGRMTGSSPVLQALIEMVKVVVQRKTIVFPGVDILLSI